MAQINFKFYWFSDRYVEKIESNVISRERIDDEQQHLLQQNFITTINKNRPEKRQQKQTNKNMDGWKRVYDQQSTENC